MSRYYDYRNIIILLASCILLAIATYQVSSGVLTRVGEGV